MGLTKYFNVGGNRNTLVDTTSGQSTRPGDSRAIDDCTELGGLLTLSNKIKYVN